MDSQKYNGFNLMEIMIVIAIISIISTLSFPLYSQYVVHARRLEAASMLSKLAVAMEQFHIEHNTYADATLTALNFSETVAKNNYRLTIQTANNNNYVLSAIPLGKQAEKDALCAALTLNANNQKGVTGSGNVSECW